MTTTDTSAEPTLTATEIVDLWEPALSRSFDLGYAVRDRECQNGACPSATAISDRWNQIIGVWRETIRHPRQVEIDAERTKPISCRTNCGRCSACTRLGAMARNRARYAGLDDFPGMDAARTIRRKIAA